MSEYTLRSTYTRTSSVLRRAADIVVILVICALLVFLLFKFILVPARAEAPRVSSVEDGELLLVDRFSRFLFDYSVGDLVLAEQDGEKAVLRVAAKAGSTYTVRDGLAYIDGALIDESEYSEGWGGFPDFEIVVPESSLLLLPDDRTELSSAEECVVPYRDITGEVRFRVSPLKRLSFFY
ncbi:MAG: S26 family signal peptidase [Clostridiales bacterium]|nr:S26 family signal peptidase [Clostridiales bacterium]